jgi:hypothetical protein
LKKNDGSWLRQNQQHDEHLKSQLEPNDLGFSVADNPEYASDILSLFILSQLVDCC